MFWGYLLCWLPFLLSVLHCTPHTNVNQGYTLYPITYNAVNSCFSLISSVCMHVRVCLQWQQVHARVRTWKNTKPSMCMHVYLCERLPVNVGIYIADRKFYVALLGLQKKKRPQRESLVCFLVTAGWGAPYQAHRLPPGVTLDTSWCVLGRHDASCQCHKRRGKWVPHHIENYPGSLRSSLKMH